MPRLLLLILLAVFFGLGVTIGFYNAQPVRFSYIFGEIELPLIGLIVGECLLVIALTLLIVLGRVLVLKSELRRLQRQLRGSEDELANLRRMSQDSQSGAVATRNV